ncbi:PEPxxWA-CTERM sorting domain-containing protein [uncultured Sphingomonas sp.]|uniref:Npun_F0296 family exosortase-dependent surface protein n=1 Tax=uncultured Sphingomonas sp. TaxID=158754 RepID=UPI0025D5A317|nr:PEPxxWA-CTERM sorting domain-containing protein [uncultured Sphingomonas sp.]
MRGVVNDDLTSAKPRKCHFAQASCKNNDMVTKHLTRIIIVAGGLVKWKCLLNTDDVLADLECPDMKTLFAAAVAVSSLFAALPAAAVTFVADNGSSDVFAASAVGAQVTFDAVTAPGFSVVGGGTMTGNVWNQGANPQGAPSNNVFMYVLANSSATVTSLAGAFQNVSLYLGSIDAGNTIDVLGQGGAVLRSFTGTDLVAPNMATGNQTSDLTNRLITFKASGNEQLTGVRFSSSVNSLEFDNVRFSAAVPEPATWAMMILGFGVVGYVMRRRPAARFAQAI